jgi:ABC-type multidrug transport system ATPase subunit
MKLLKDLSVKMHVASMVIIHQPDPDTFSLFDRLILLSKGRFLFSGECSNLSVFYNRNYDEGLPDKYHIARDFILKASEYGVSNEDNLDYYKGNDHKVLDSSSELSFNDNISGGLSGKSILLPN